MREALAGARGLGLAAALLTLGGCGDTPSGVATPSAVEFKSPAVSDGIIQPSVRCGGGALWLPLKWGAVPAGTKELAIYFNRFKYKQVGGRRKLVIPYADLIYHIKPSVHEIPANTLPSTIAWSDVGRINCPLAKRNPTVLLQLFAFDRTRRERVLTRRQAMALTGEALRTKGKTGANSIPPGGLMEDVIGTGRFIAGYAR
ncbi:MAG: hypothetical protein ACJ75S_05495 [Solirubrobacterales bacterium]